MGAGLCQGVEEGLYGGAALIRRSIVHHDQFRRALARAEIDRRLAHGHIQPAKTIEPHFRPRFMPRDQALDGFRAKKKAPANWVP
jgi:hypothetical protein